MSSETASAPRSDRRSGWRRWGRTTAIAAITLLAALAMAIGWVSRPARLTALILDRVGSALDLQITATGPSEYRLRGTPMLTVRGLDVRQPGADTPLLTADRAYLALPWTTLWAGGKDLTVRRVELDGPHLDLHALQGWLATRPAGGPLRIPTLTEGARIVRGQLDGDGWSVDRITISTVQLAPTQPFAARLGGRFQQGPTSAPFDMHLALTHPGIDAGAGLAGIASIRSAQWWMPITLQLSGVLRDDDDGTGLDRARLAANMRWFNDPVATEPGLSFAAGLAGRMRYRDSRLLIAPLGIALRGQDGVPEQFDASGSLTLGDTLALSLHGEIGDWPSVWPALPAPLGDSHSPFPFALDYAGTPDLRDEAHLQLRRDDTRFDGRFRVPEVSAWLEQLATGTPLPPMRGTLDIPRIEIAGATLSGVRLQLDDDEPDTGAALPAPEPVN